MNENENANPILDRLKADENLQPLVDIVSAVLEMSDDSLTDENTPVVATMFRSAFTEAIKDSGTQNLMKNLKERGMSNLQTTALINDSIEGLHAILREINTTDHKRRILESVFEEIEKIFVTARDQFSSFDINLDIVVGKNGTIPTYAHPSDAGADIYAAEDVTLPAHSLSNSVPTDIRIGLPDNWTALILPRSSMGTKTGLRLSNSMGVIDSEYRGTIGVFYDNISDSDYEIKKGDRIAQMLIIPTYRFKAHPVDILPETERGEGGFGSTGK